MSSPSSSSVLHSSNVVHFVPSRVTSTMLAPIASPESSPAARAASALMMEPSVLLLDEPSAGLSPVMQDEVFVQTRRINRAGVSVIMVEQNARRCLQICDRGYVLDQGRNAYTAEGKDLMNDPKVIELYLGTLAKN